MKRKKGTLKHEADTLQHMVTYRLANPYCDVCVRAKMRHFKTKKGAFKQQLEKWGDLVTFDFLTPERAGQPGKETDTKETWYETYTLELGWRILLRMVPRLGLSDA